MTTHVGHGPPSTWWISRVGEVIGMRVRYGWLGRPIVQIRRAHYRSQGAWPSPDREWELDTDTAFMDATRNDIPEIQEYLKRPLKDYTIPAAPPQ